MVSGAEPGQVDQPDTSPRRGKALGDISFMAGIHLLSIYAGMVILVA